jgi:hypothetical protein
MVGVIDFNRPVISVSLTVHDSTIMCPAMVIWQMICKQFTLSFFLSLNLGRSSETTQDVEALLKNGKICSGLGSEGFDPDLLYHSHTVKKASQIPMWTIKAGPNNVGVGKFQPAHRLVLRSFGTLPR